MNELSAPAPIVSSRLRLVPFTAALARAACDDDRPTVALLLDADVPADWPGPDFAELLPQLAETLAQTPETGAFTRVIVDRYEKQVVGDIGFYGDPDRLYVGYCIVPDWRDQGYATEALRALVAWAWANLGASIIHAECDSENYASARVLTKAAFSLHSEEFWDIKRPQ